MNIIIKGASGFMGLFDTGAETFVSWVSGIVPKVLLLLILMNTIIALIGQERVNKFAKLCSGNVILAYGVLPFISAFMLGNPMALSMGKFLPERMKPSYYAFTLISIPINQSLFFNSMHEISGLLNNLNLMEWFPSPRLKIIVVSPS